MFEVLEVAITLSILIFRFYGIPDRNQNPFLKTKEYFLVRDTFPLMKKYFGVRILDL
jgi:hypothetical protein